MLADAVIIAPRCRVVHFYLFFLPTRGRCVFCPPERATRRALTSLHFVSK